jgi:GNAT superfamily N-acetyltransferase
MSARHVRDAHAADRDAIRGVTLAAYEEYAAQMQPEHWAAYRWNILATLEQVAPAEQLVAEDDGAVVGTVLLYPPAGIMRAPDTAPPASPWPEVRLLAVAPARRGAGIGAALMEECVRRARRTGTSALGLHTTDMMQAATRMYARMGFVRAPELDFHPLPGLTIKGYRLDLARRSTDTD